MSWFAQHGSPTAEWTVRVRKPGALRAAVAHLAGGVKDPSPGSARRAEAIRRRQRLLDRRSDLPQRWAALVERLPVADGEPSPYGMFAIPEQEVLRHLSAHAGETIAVEEDHSAGWDWISRAYFVRKAGA